MVLEDEPKGQYLNRTLTQEDSDGGWGRCTWPQPCTFAADSAVHSTAAS